MEQRIHRKAMKWAAVGSVLAAATILCASPGPGQAAEAPKAPKKPNIVVIMTDDVGWGDLGCYGGGETRGAPTLTWTAWLRKACVSPTIMARRAVLRGGLLL